MINGEIKTIAVIGAGTMGQGIAQVCALAGFKVLLYDIQSELIVNGITIIRKNLDIAVEKNKLTAEQRQQASVNIISTGDFRNLQVDLVIEAVIEKLEVKQKMFAELEKINGKDCILTSNTSSIPITQIASALKHQGRFAGLHFFNPAPVMKLIEVIKGASTEDVVVEKLIDFSRTIGKIPVSVKDSPGFIVNRVARHYYVESLRILEENVADVQTVDQLMRSVGFKMGPFELMDLIGVDTNFSVTSSMYNAFHQDPKFRPSRIQQKKVDAGHWGRKSGKGFYDYPTEA
jgi:3-hydroxybutyryl-CoA dehydrogenase